MTDLNEYADSDFIEEEQFGVLSNLLPHEIDEIREKQKKEREEIRQIPSLFWIAKEIKVHPDDLGKALKLIRNNSAYRVVYIPKPNGKKREICIPCPTLMRIQSQINKHVLRYLNPAPNVFGFSGGNIAAAITPHLSAKIILCVDLVNAFPTITSDNVLNYLTSGREAWRRLDGTIKIEKWGWFSWYAAKALAELVTYKGSLPQGPPTSPRLFDLLCRKIDKGLLKLARNVGGNYTRYADNIFFSMGEEEFPRPLGQAILKLIEGRHWSPSKPKHKRKTLNFDWHKLKARKTAGNSLRILGLNVIDGKIHNTRDFKRQLRLSIHHVNWLLSHGQEDTPEFEKAWQKLRGQMNFARIDTLPPKLLNDYLELEKQLK